MSNDVDETTGEVYTDNIAADGGDTNNRSLVHIDNLALDAPGLTIEQISKKLRSVTMYTSAKTTLFKEEVGNEFLWIGGVMQSIPSYIERESQKVMPGYELLLMKVIRVSKKGVYETLTKYGNDDLEPEMIRCSARQPQEVFTQMLRPVFGSYDWNYAVHVKIVPGAGSLVNLQVLEVLMPGTTNVVTEGQ